MERHSLRRTYACPPHKQSRGVATIWRLAIYLLLVSGIWIAYLWFVYFDPIAMSPDAYPKAAVVLDDRLAPPPNLPRNVVIAERKNDRQSESMPPVTSALTVTWSPSDPAADPFRVNPSDLRSRTKLVLEIQKALARSGCYRGAMTGEWSANTKRALSAFLSAANARLPIEQPDYILLSLVQGHGRVVCGEIHPVDAQLLAPLKLNSRRAAPPGLMGIGGPVPETNVTFAKPRTSVTSFNEPASGSSRKQTRRTGDGRVYVTQPPRARSELRAVRELLTHPLGTF